MSVAKDATDWLSTGGGWAMFVVAGVVIYFLVRHILSLNAKLDAKEASYRAELSGLLSSHKLEMERVSKEHNDKLEDKDEKLFDLLDKTNETLSAIQQLKKG